MASATSANLVDEIRRVQKERRHAIAMTPLASVPLDCRKQDKRRKPFIITKSPGQTMRYPKRPAIYDR